MFGVPNPNLMTSAPPPPRAKKKPVAVIVIVVLVLIAAVVAGIFLFKGKAAELGFDELSQTVLNTEQALLSANVTEYLNS